MKDIIWETEDEYLERVEEEEVAEFIDWIEGQDFAEEEEVLEDGSGCDCGYYQDQCSGTDDPDFPCPFIGSPNRGCYK